MGDSDLFALARQGDKVCVLVWFFRAGQNQGGKPYFQTVEASVSDAEVMDSFLAHSTTRTRYRRRWCCPKRRWTATCCRRPSRFARAGASPC